MVNMAQANCYTLRRSPGAEEFRRAWDAALDCGLAQMKDIAFERAIEGELIPVFANGKHMGFCRKRNDALLIRAELAERSPWHGTLEPPVTMEEVELDGEEAHWSQIGREKPEWLVEW